LENPCLPRPLNVLSDLPECRDGRKPVPKIVAVYWPVLPTEKAEG